MGARNVSACFAVWPHLPHAAFRLLVGMALTALDNPSSDGRPPRVYFGGEDGMTELLGGGRSAVYRALATLREAGAVDVLDAGRSGHRAVYKLRLDVIPSSSSVPEVGPTSVPEVGRRASRKRDAERPASGTPRTDQGSDQESRLGKTSPNATHSPAAVDNARVIYLPTRSATR